MTATIFSAAGRDAVWASLGEDVFDLVVIGGGITGSGVARDAAGRGLRVAVVEQGDVGAGTSSRSSRLIHGGLRYLETFEFGLVFEALRERRLLLQLAPHLVKPLPFLYPVFKGDRTGPLKLRAGMWLYDLLSTFRSPRFHRMLNPAGVARTEPLLEKAGVRGGAIYYDAQVDDARLTLAVARAAVETGVTYLTHARVDRITPLEGRGFEMEVIDGMPSGHRTTVRANTVLNATGPWCDEVRRLADADITPRLRPTKGVHVVVDQRRVGNQGAILLRSNVDGRVMFVLPWGALTYLGTTDTEFQGDPDSARANLADVQYLLDSANALFPEARLELDDVVSTWAGVRPLLAPAPRQHLSESETSREHEIWRDPSGLVNIAGGKLTTFRSMAAEAVDFLTAILKEEFGVPSGNFHTEFLPLPGAPQEDWEGASLRLQSAAMALGIPPSTAALMVNRYGEDITDVLALVRDDASLGEPLLPGGVYIRAEVIYAVRAELALTLEDVMRRRLHLFYEEVDGGLSVARRIAAMMGAELGGLWGPDEEARQVAAYEATVEATRPRSAAER